MNGRTLEDRRSPPFVGPLKRSSATAFSTQGAQTGLQGASNHTNRGLRQQQARNGMILAFSSGTPYGKFDHGHPLPSSWDFFGVYVGCTRYKRSLDGLDLMGYG